MLSKKSHRLHVVGRLAAGSSDGSGIVLLDLLDCGVGGLVFSSQHMGMWRSPIMGPLII